MARRRNLEPPPPPVERSADEWLAGYERGALEVSTKSTEPTPPVGRDEPRGSTRRPSSRAQFTGRRIRVPVADLAPLVRRSARLVADLPVGASQVVWERPPSELLVLIGDVGIKLGDGTVTISVPVSCDELQGLQPTRRSTRAMTEVAVPFAVGSATRPAGLVMATSRQPQGPDVVVRVWSDALVAFAFETLVHLASSLAAARGEDRRGLKFIPGALVASADALFINPMERHSIQWGLS